ncbi:MAG: ATP-binding protein, partial [Bacteroidota bacterium]
ASEYYRRSIPYVEAVKDNEVLASDYYGLAKVFHQNDVADSSIYYARKALDIAQEYSFLKQVLDASSFLTSAFKNKKQFDSAFKYQELSIATRDSLFNVDKARKVQTLKFQEQQRLQSIETERMEFRNKIKSYILTGSAFILLFIVFILWRYTKQKQEANILLQFQKTKAEKAFEDLKSTQALLIQSEKMASLGELTAGIAHEIQNPLNFVNNFSEVNRELMDELRSEAVTGNNNEVIAIADDIIQNNQRIHHHGKRASAIIRSMLEHSRSSSGKVEPTDINLLTDEHLRLSYNGFRAKEKSFHATIKTDFDGNVGNINVVPQDVGRLLLNLFNNSFYALAQKQKQMGHPFEPIISVSTKKIETTAGNQQVEIVVTDNGTGIPDSIMGKIFQPFFTTKPTGEGTGLGLSLSYDIVKSFGGTITATSKEGESTSFAIMFPA